MKPRPISELASPLSRARRPAQDPPVKGRGKLGASLQDTALERMTGTIAELEKMPGTDPGGSDP